jgi:hypothetical protein
MSIQNPPITENPSLDFTLLELIRLINDLENKNLKLINDIKTSTNFADLQTKVNT